MKKTYTVLLLCFIFVNSFAQSDSKSEEKKEFEIDSTLVLTLNTTINTLYSSISGEKGEERNWKQFNHLFKNDAKLIPSYKNEDGLFEIRHMSPKDYINISGNWLVENGFFEKEIHREVDVFGNIAQVFSTYESFHSKTDEHPFMRGINSIQLLNDGERWWIVSVYWTQETPENPIPKKYLP